MRLRSSSALPSGRRGGVFVAKPFDRWFMRTRVPQDGAKPFDETAHAVVRFLQEGAEAYSLRSHSIDNSCGRAFPSGQRGGTFAAKSFDRRFMRTRVPQDGAEVYSLRRRSTRRRMRSRASDCMSTSCARSACSSPISATNWLTFRPRASCMSLSEPRGETR